MGEFGQYVLGTSYPGGGLGDAGILALTYGFWPLYPGYINWSSNFISTVTGYELTAPPVGTWVCQNGATSGSSCGTVQATGVEIPETEADGTFLGYVDDTIEVVGTCTNLGDSGGPLTLASSTTAVGITNAADSPGSCSSPDFFTPVNDALGYFAVQLVVG